MTVTTGVIRNRIQQTIVVNLRNPEEWLILPDDAAPHAFAEIDFSLFAEQHPDEGIDMEMFHTVIKNAYTDETQRALIDIEMDALSNYDVENAMTSQDMFGCIKVAIDAEYSLNLVYVNSVSQPDLAQIVFPYEYGMSNITYVIREYKKNAKVWLRVERYLSSDYWNELIKRYFDPGNRDRNEVEDLFQLIMCSLVVTNCDYNRASIETPEDIAAFNAILDGIQSDNTEEIRSLMGVYNKHLESEIRDLERRDNEITEQMQKLANGEVPVYTLTDKDKAAKARFITFCNELDGATRGNNWVSQIIKDVKELTKTTEERLTTKLVVGTSATARINVLKRTQASIQSMLKIYVVAKGRNQTKFHDVKIKNATEGRKREMDILKLSNTDKARKERLQEARERAILNIRNKKEAARLANENKKEAVKTAQANRMSYMEKVQDILGGRHATALAQRKTDAEATRALRNKIAEAMDVYRNQVQEAKQAQTLILNALKERALDSRDEQNQMLNALRTRGYDTKEAQNVINNAFKERGFEMKEARDELVNALKDAMFSEKKAQNLINNALKERTLDERNAQNVLNNAFKDKGLDIKVAQNDIVNALRQSGMDERKAQNVLNTALRNRALDIRIDQLNDNREFKERTLDMRTDQINDNRQFKETVYNETKIIKATAYADKLSQIKKNNNYRRKTFKQKKQLINRRNRQATARLKLAQSIKDGLAIAKANRPDDWKQRLLALVKEVWTSDDVTAATTALETFGNQDDPIGNRERLANQAVLEMDTNMQEMKAAMETMQAEQGAIEAASSDAKGGLILATEEKQRVVDEKKTQLDWIMELQEELTQLREDQALGQSVIDAVSVYGDIHPELEEPIRAFLQDLKDKAQKKADAKALADEAAAMGSDLPVDDSDDDQTQINTVVVPISVPVNTIVVPNQPIPNQIQGDDDDYITLTPVPKIPLNPPKASTSSSSVNPLVNSSLLLGGKKVPSNAVNPNITNKKGSRQANNKKTQTAPTAKQNLSGDDI